jgi:hypothetical protein
MLDKYEQAELLIPTSFRFLCNMNELKGVTAA